VDQKIIEMVFPARESDDDDERCYKPEINDNKINNLLHEIYTFIYLFYFYYYY
jgi:hypothetical protein